jgi:serine/threonine-protein kinase SRPK3
LGKTFELATNKPLFPLGTFGLSKEQIDEEHLGLINRLLGDDDSVNKTFMQHLTDKLPANFGGANIESFASLLRFMLQQDPQKRISAARLLKHAFLGGGTWS